MYLEIIICCMDYVNNVILAFKVTNNVQCFIFESYIICNLIVIYLVYVGLKYFTDKPLNDHKCYPRVHVRGMAGKFVDTSAIRKSNALLKKRFA